MDLPADDPALAGLLEHADWVRSLARSMVLDPARADDLVQEAWLAALRHPPAPERARSWFRTVLRNAHTSQLRREAARALRERAVARPEAEPVAEGALARARALAEVLAAATDLDEPYRTAILLRYADGLSPSAVAAHLDVPLETVKTRLKRGLTQLRQRLDRRPGGRASWSALLLPTLLEREELLALARGRLVPVDGGLVPVAPLGTAPLALPASLAGAGLAVVLAGMLAWVATRGARYPGPSGLSPDPAPVEELRALRVLPARVVGERERAGGSTLAPAPTVPVAAAWEGEVRDAHGPLAGVPVQLRTEQGHVLAHAVSDAQGRWTLAYHEPEVRTPTPHGELHGVLDRGLPPRGWLHLWTDGRAYGATPHVGARSDALPGRPATSVELELRPAFEQRVRVLDPQGRPLAGVLVEATDTLELAAVARLARWADEARTDESGEALLRVPGEQSVRLRVAPGQGVVGVELEHLARPGGEAVQLVTRAHAAELTLVVVDGPSGLALLDARVESLSLPLGASPRETPDALPLAVRGGEVRLVRPPGAGPWLLRVQAPGHRPRRVFLAGDPGERVELPLWPSRDEVVQVRAGVRPARGVLHTSQALEPLELGGSTPGTPMGAPLWFRDLHEHHAVPLDATGLARVPSGREGGPGRRGSPWCRVELELPDGRAVPIRSPFRADGPHRVQLEPPMERVAYRLVDARGLPLGNVPVRVLAFGSDALDASELLPLGWGVDGRALDRGAWEDQLAGVWPEGDGSAPDLARTDADGRLEVLLPRGAEVFLETREGVLEPTGSGGSDRAPRPASLVRHDLELAGAVVGADGRPSADAPWLTGTLAFRSLDRPGHWAQVWFERDGTFHGVGFDEGRWQLDEDGFEPVVARGGQVDLRVPLPPLWTLDLDLRDPSGEPLTWEGEAVVLLTLRDADGATTERRTGLGHHHLQRLRVPLRAPVHLELRVPGFAPLERELGGGPGPQDLELRPRPLTVPASGERSD